VINEVNCLLIRGYLMSFPNFVKAVLLNF